MPETTASSPYQETPEAEDYTCENCGIAAGNEGLFHNERLGLAVCETCDLDHPELHECGHCGAEYESEDEAYDCCRYGCPECGSEWHYEEEAIECCSTSGAAYPSLPTPTEPDYQITVPVIEGRPARLCSIEQEVTRGGREAAQMLYDYGFSRSPDFESYSSPGAAGYVSVKPDGSLPDEGGEIVYSRFLLSREEDVRSLSGAAARMRQLARETNTVRVGRAAGVHIHVSATAEDGTRLSPSGMAALHEIFCYAEDFLYSFAAAGWDAHRARPGDYGGYCKPLPKLASGEKGTAWRVHGLMRSDRYFGLNFQRLLGAATNCSCGAARFGEWEACECGAFDTATVEWRVFNASTKPETLHAWLLVAHALTAMANSHRLGTLDPHEYGTTDQEGRLAVQRWIEQNAPLTDDEVQVIRAAARRSPGLGKPRR